MQRIHYKKLLITTLFLALAVCLQAQSNGKADSDDIFAELMKPDSASGASVTLLQDANIPVLFERVKRMNQKSGLMGFRIQIYNGSGQDAREAIQKLTLDLTSKFPEIDASVIYQEYQAPFFKLRVGDFRTRNEAFELYNQIKHYYPNCYIVKSRIHYPKLYAVQNPESLQN